MAKTSTARTAQFTDWTVEGCELTEAQRETDGPDYRKQAGEAMARESRMDADADEARVAEVSHTIETARDCPNAQMAYRTTQRCAREPNWTRGRLGKRVPRNAFGLTEDANTELARLKITPRELWAAAVAATAREHPEAFGLVTDMDVLDQRRKAIQTRLTELYTLIETKFTGEDVVFLETNTMMRKEGWVALAYKLSDGQVRTGQDSARHLIDWLLEHPDKIPSD